MSAQLLHFLYQGFSAIACGKKPAKDGESADWLFRPVAEGLCHHIGRAWPQQTFSLRFSRPRLHTHRGLPRLGAAVVEFAIVAPLFFLLLLGIIEFGRMVMVQQVLTNASREGARVAVVDGSTAQEVMERARAILAPAGIRSAEIRVEPNPPSTALPGAPVTVTVRVPFREVSWLPTPLFLRNITLQATTVMRRESV